METISTSISKKDLFIQEDREPRYWTLYYRYSNIPQMTKSFKLEGSMRDAVARGRKHCEIMSYVFICVRPLVVDLDHQEQNFLIAQEKGTEAELR